MPKPMKVLVEVEEIAHGRLFRLLDGMQGVVSITPVGDGPKAGGNGGANAGQKRGGAQSTLCVVLGALAALPSGRSMERTGIQDALTTAGKSANVTASTLKALRDKGEIKRIGSGRSVSYAITARGRETYKTACLIQPPKGA